MEGYWSTPAPPEPGYPICGAVTAGSGQPCHSAVDEPGERCHHHDPSLAPMKAARLRRRRSERERAAGFRMVRKETPDEVRLLDHVGVVDALSSFTAALRVEGCGCACCQRHVGMRDIGTTSL